MKHLKLKNDLKLSIQEFLRWSLTFTLIFTLAACSEGGVDKSHSTASPPIFEEVEPSFQYSPATAAGIDSIVASLDSVKTAVTGLEARVASSGFSEMDFSLSENRKHVSARDAIVKEAFESVYLPLADVVLNPNYIYDSHFSTVREFRRQYRELNKSIRLMEKLDPEFVKAEGIYSRYWNAFTSRCDVDMRGCEYAKKLMRSDGSRSTRIFEAYAWALHESIQAIEASGDLTSEDPIGARETQTRHRQLILKKKDVIQVAYGARTGGRQETSTLGLLYLVSTNELQDLPMDMWAAEDREQYDRNAERVTRDLKDRLNDPTYRETIKPFFDKKSIWRTFTLRDPIEQRKNIGSLRTAVEVMKLSCKFFRDKDAGFESSIKDSLTNVDAWGNDGFVKVVDELRADPGSSLTLANMRLLEPFKASEELFYLDQVYRGHWNREILQECWSASGAGLTKAQREQRNKDMMLLIERYIKVEFLRRTIATNLFMKRIFESDDGKNTSIERDRLFTQAIEESRLLKSDWDRMTRSFEDIRGFVAGNMSGTESSSEETAEFQRLDRIFTSIKTNIKVVSVYPNMLLLAYYLAARDFEVEITTPWGFKFKLEAGTIINWLFGGATNDPARPWFNFGNDTRPIKRFENLYSFFYALKTNTFDNFSNSSGADDVEGANASTGDATTGILDALTSDAVPATSVSSVDDPTQAQLNVMNFFAEVIRRYIATDVTSISEKMKEVEREYNGSVKYESGMDICSAEMAAHQYNENKRLVRTGLTEKNSYTLDLSLSKFHEQTFAGLTLHTPGEKIGKIYSGDLESILGRSHTNFYPKVLFVRTMMEILEDHLNSHEDLQEHPSFPDAARKRLDSAIKIQQKMDEVKSNFNIFYDTVRRAYQMVRKMDKEASHCVDLFTKIEKEQQDTLYDMEATFLGYVYDALILFTDIMNDPARREALAPSVTGPEIAEIFERALNGYYDDEAKAKIDLPELSVLAEYARVYKDKPGDLPIDEIGFDEFNSSGSFLYSRFNYVLRARNNLKEVNPNIEISFPTSFDTNGFYTEAKDDRRRAKINLGENPTKKEFIRKAMTAAENLQFVSWWSKRSIAFFNYRRELKEDLYRVEQLGIIDNARENCKLNSVKDSDEVTCSEWVEYPEIQMHEIVDEIWRVVDYIEIKPEDRPRLMRLGKETNVAFNWIKMNFLDSQLAPRTIFEEYYTRFTSGEFLSLYFQAKDAAETFNSMFKDESSKSSKDFKDIDWRNQEARELLFLAKHDTVRSNTREVYRPVVLVTERAAEEFEDVIFCHELMDRDKPKAALDVLYRLEVDDRGFIQERYLEQKVSDSSPAVYLDPKDIENWAARKTSFRQDTKGVYQANDGDADFVPGVPAEKVRDEAFCKKVLGIETAAAGGEGE